MAPVVCLIRHAQALHNVHKESHLKDPELTELGRQQCKDFQEHIRKHWPEVEKAELIVTSPFRRTLETTTIGLSWLIEKGVPVLPRPEWQGLQGCGIELTTENANKPCDTGTNLKDLAVEWPQYDFSDVDPTFPSKTGLYEWTQTAVLERGRAAKAWLQARPEKLILVVTHSAFLRTAVVRRRFANADYRIFRFVEDEGSVDLVEDSWTEEAGGAMGRSTKGIMTLEEHDFLDAEDELAARPV